MQKKGIESVAILRDAVGELLEVANLRGDNELPSPPDDPKLWTARMQSAWDSLDEAYDALVISKCEECGKETDQLTEDGICKKCHNTTYKPFFDYNS